jgi:hypothetical protein
MPQALLIIRLHPETPVSGEEFTNYLKGLSIAAHDLRFGDEGKGPAFGKATYLAPTLRDLPEPPVPNPETRITQHFEVIPGEIRNFFAVATAVIEIPKDIGWNIEHRALDVRLVITRDGKEIVHKQLYYNVVGQLPPQMSAEAILKDPNGFPNLQPVHLHVALPAPGQQLAPTVAEPVELDVALPSFADLRAAMVRVLGVEVPGPDFGLPDEVFDPDPGPIAKLTREQCRHVAAEITWDQTTHLLPVPNRSLEGMYTYSFVAGSEVERDRQLFESRLSTHYARLNTETEHLTNFVFAVSAAIWCEWQTRIATQAGFSFPVFLTAPAQEEKVVLNGAATPLGFEVPAEYFYAVTAILPLQVMREERYNTAVQSPEEQTVASIEHALNQHLINEPATVNRYQAARRLRALGTVDEFGTPGYVLPPPVTSKVVPAQRLVNNWLSFSGADLSPFWNALPAPDLRGHLDLLLTVITKEHAPLIAAITGTKFGVKDVNGLAAKNTAEWKGLLQPNPNLLPEFTKPGTTEERTQAFIRYLGKFFEVPKVFEPSPAPTPAPAPAIDHPGNPLDALLANDPGFSFDEWNATGEMFPGDPVKQKQFTDTLGNIFPRDEAKQKQFTEWLKCIQGVTKLAEKIEPHAIRFSVIEALWARGFTNAASIKDLSLDDFKEALAGSIAYDYADAIKTNAGPGEPPREQTPAGFKPVNPDGSIVNCVPPAHLSPLGPVAYLHDLLRVGEESNCNHPIPKQSSKTLGAALANRRGPVLSITMAQLTSCGPKSHSPTKQYSPNLAASANLTQPSKVPCRNSTSFRAWTWRTLRSSSTTSAKRKNV